MAQQFSMSRPKLWPTSSCYDRCQRILLPSPSRMQRNMGPGPKWNILFKCYWSECYRIKEKEVLNNLQCTSIMFFFRKLIFQGPPLDNKLWNAQKNYKVSHWGGCEIKSCVKITDSFFRLCLLMLFPCTWWLTTKDSLNKCNISLGIIYQWAITVLIWFCLYKSQEKMMINIHFTVYQLFVLDTCLCWNKWKSQPMTARHS